MWDKVVGTGEEEKKGGKQLCPPHLFGAIFAGELSAAFPIPSLENQEFGKEWEQKP